MEAFLAPVDPELLGPLRREWHWAVPDTYRTLGMTWMGDWLFLDGDGAVFLLDTLEANLTPVASSLAGLEDRLRTEDTRDELLLEGLALGVLGDRSLPPDQCVGQRVPVILGGGTTVSNLEIVPVGPYQRWIARLHRALADVPEGARVTDVTVDDAGAVDVRWDPPE